MALRYLSTPAGVTKRQAVCALYQQTTVKDRPLKAQVILAWTDRGGHGQTDILGRG